jgi:septal ring factor EnvC (AmiA/AmiB activator)
MKRSTFNSQLSTVAFSIPSAKTFACVCLAVLFLLMTGASGSRQTDSPAVETGKLINEISALEDRIEALERKIDNLNSKIDELDYSIYKSGQEIIDKIEDVESAVKSLR